MLSLCHTLLHLVRFALLLFKKLLFLSTRQLSVPQLQSPLQSQLGVLLLSQQPSSLVLLQCVDDFQQILLSRHRSNFFETLFSACASACRWHFSFLSFGSPCCWVCSSRLQLAVFFCVLTRLCHFVQHIFCSSSSKFFASVLLFGNLALPLSLTSFHRWLFWL